MSGTTAQSNQMIVLITVQERKMAHLAVPRIGLRLLQQNIIIIALAIQNGMVIGSGGGGEYTKRYTVFLLLAFRFAVSQ